MLFGRSLSPDVVAVASVVATAEFVFCVEAVAGVVVAEIDEVVVGVTIALFVD